MIWATVMSFFILGCKERSQFDFGIDHLVMSMCRVFSCVIGKRCLIWPVSSFGKTLSLFPASFCTPKPHFTPGISWLPTFAFQSPIKKRTSFLGASSRRSLGLHRTIQLQLLQHYWSGHRLGLLWYWIISQPYGIINLLSIYGFEYYRHFLQMESHNM